MVAMWLWTGIMMETSGSFDVCNPKPFSNTKGPNKLNSKNSPAAI